MKWDDGNRKTNKTTNWSEKCYVCVRAPREAGSDLGVAEAACSRRYGAWLIRQAYQWRRVTAPCDAHNSAKWAQLLTARCTVAPTVFAYNTWDNLSLA